jgi:hypothetical protein
MDNQVNWIKGCCLLFVKEKEKRIEKRGRAVRITCSGLLLSFF